MYNNSLPQNYNNYVYQQFNGYPQQYAGYPQQFDNVYQQQYYENPYGYQQPNFIHPHNLPFYGRNQWADSTVYYNQAGPQNFEYQGPTYQPRADATVYYNQEPQVKHQKQNNVNNQPQQNQVAQSAINDPFSGAYGQTDVIDQMNLIGPRTIVSAPKKDPEIEKWNVKRNINREESKSDNNHLDNIAGIMKEIESIQTFPCTHNGHTGLNIPCKRQNNGTEKAITGQLELGFFDIRYRNPMHAYFVPHSSTKAYDEKLVMAKEDIERLETKIVELSKKGDKFSVGKNEMFQTITIEDSKGKSTFLLHDKK